MDINDLYSKELLQKQTYCYKFVATESDEGKITYRINLIVDAHEKEIPTGMLKRSL